MITGNHRAVDHVQPGSARMQLRSDALLEWEHRHGGVMTSLVRVRQLTKQDSGSMTYVVVSELWLRSRKRYVLSDAAGAAQAVTEQLLPRSVSPALAAWYVHHGQFSTPDPSGPESLTRLDLDWTGPYPQLTSWDQRSLVGPTEAASLHERLDLQPVSDVLHGLRGASQPHWTTPPGQSATAEHGR